MSEAKREIAVRQELGHGHLTAFSNKVPPDTLVVVIRVRALTDLLPSANYTGSSGPYVELSLSPGDAAAGEQLQRTSYKPGTSNPRWVRPILNELRILTVDDHDSLRNQPKNSHSLCRTPKIPRYDFQCETPSSTKYILCINVRNKSDSASIRFGIQIALVMLFYH